MIYIRQIEMGDIVPLLDIAALSPGAATWSREAYETFLANPGQGSCWAAEHQGRLAGFVCFRIVRGEAELLNLAVLPDLRRQGIGSGLLDVALQETGEAGATKMFLEVRESNAEALRLYQRFGFSRCGRREGYYANPPADALILVRYLEGQVESHCC